MKQFCDRNLDTAFILPLIHTIIESILQDHSISKLLYGASFIDKEKLTGSYAHPSSICLEALLLGLIYHTHKCPKRAIVNEIILIAAPKRHTFRIVRYSDKYDLETDTHISLAASLFENSHHQDSTPLLNIPDIEFTDCNDLFKAILLRYRYQNEYSNWHDCCVCEGEKNTIQEISELKRIAGGISYIPELTFAECNSLTDCRIPGSIQAIGDNAFRNCTSLQKLTIPYSVTQISDCAFSGCGDIEFLSPSSPKSKLDITSYSHDTLPMDYQ